MDLSRNLPLFIAFRVLFNARFYYPVIGVLFLDLGLTLEQYSLLNVAWAIAIVTLEIPSGALADVIGRKRMVVLAAAFMVAEMLLFAFAPTGRPGLLFGMLLLNRILSGAAEASASGADEALAFESLPAENRDKAWPKILERLMRWQSGAFFVVMIAGALLYDPAFARSVAKFLGSSWTPATGEMVRWPVYATLATSFLCLSVALGLREPPQARREDGGSLLRQALLNVRDGARGVITDRRILLVILAALTCDSIVRLFFTFEANYLRLIEIPEYLFGVIGAALGLFGFIAAPLARKMTQRTSAPASFGTIAALVIIGLGGATLATPFIGVWVIIPLGIGMNLLTFFVSHYLNLWALPEMRATVLSFRGVALNLTYGTAGILFAALTKHLREAAPSHSENLLFSESLRWLPPAFLALAGTVAIYAHLSRGKCNAAAHPQRPA
ncbi:MAG TPA: MFS transporter [Chthoniobacterales bacterium]|nr:MFS transporter [Chthoniobacterales bacterium]